MTMWIMTMTPHNLVFVWKLALFPTESPLPT